MILIFIAPPGAGKTTQSKLLEDKLNLKRIATGEIFRAYFKDHASWFDYTKYAFENGVLCYDETINDLVKRYLPQDNYLLDGYPKTLPQAEYFNNRLTNLYRAIYIQVEKDVLIKRLYERESNEKTIKSKLEIYEKQTAQLILYYKNLDILIEQDGSGTVENVASELITKIK